MKTTLLSTLVLCAASWVVACSADPVEDGVVSTSGGTGGGGTLASGGVPTATGAGGSAAGVATGGAGVVASGGVGALATGGQSSLGGQPTGGASGTTGGASGTTGGVSGTTGGVSGTTGGASGTTGGVSGTTGGASTGGASGTTGGATSTGGNAPTGGAAATGGAGTGGVAAGTGGSAPGTGGSGAVTGAGFTITATISLEVATVGIVEWSIDQTITSAHIEFGREQGAYEYSAPVDLAEPSYRTLLLGMKPATTYYFRIVAEGTGGSYASDVQTIETDYLPNALPGVTVSDTNASALFGGFTVNCTGVGSVGSGQSAGDTWVFILDRDGDFVWAYDFTDTPAAGCSRARMSYDGKHMWAGNFSNMKPDGALVRVTMDGLSEPQAYSFPGRHHDFAVLPNNHVLFYEQENGGNYLADHTEGADIIEELDPETGAASQIYHENTDFSVQIAESGAHTNQIRYVPFMNAISFSLRHTNTIGVISYPDAQLITVFGGPLSDYPIEWNVQHGHQLLENTLLVFNNEGSNGGSNVLEFQYDIDAKTAIQVLDYSSGNSSQAFGDVQRLSNGNTFVTYSSTGVFHEIDAFGALLREMTTDPVGYSEHRRTLYGPPPPFAD